MGVGEVVGWRQEASRILDGLRPLGRVWLLFGVGIEESARNLGGCDGIPAKVAQARRAGLLHRR